MRDRFVDAIQSLRTVLYRCPECDYAWPVVMRYELGRYWFIGDENDECPICGKEGVEE